jgi:ABC-2 type transport system ATP-binding protein
LSPAITISQLIKTFGQTRALDGLDLTVETGEVHGFLGPNGAGKSTTIRILLGLLRSDSGSVRLLGGNPWADAVDLHRRLAYIPDSVSLWPNLSGGEVIDLFATLRGSLNHARRRNLIERFKLDPTRKCGTYSHGNRQKVAIISAFASDVELLLLDEPTGGLDPLMVQEFRECVREARSEGRTVLMCSHILADVEALCDRVSIIRDGRTVESGTLTELRHLTRTAITVEVERPFDGIADLAGVHEAQVDGNRASFQVDTDSFNDVLKQLTTRRVLSMTSSPPSLEELFMRHYGDAAESEDQERAEEIEKRETGW